MKENPQGRRWHRLDNTGKLFPMIANENLSNVFRVSAVLKLPVKPLVLQKALEQVLPHFKGFRVKLKRGFFWYYFEGNRRTAYVEEERDWPCRYIDPKSNQLYLFRVSYYETRINLEVFHAVTDGKGAVDFLRELTYRYLRLIRGSEGVEVAGEISCGVQEDSYLKNYKKLPNRSYSSKPAYRLEGEYLPFGGTSVVLGCVSVSQLKKVCRARGVSITKYLTACLIWSIYKEYLEGRPEAGHIGVNLPINLRAFFGSSTTSNFFAVTSIDYDTKGEEPDFERILQSVSEQMDEKIVKERLEKIISYNVSREKKWYVRITPLFVKWLALGIIFKRNDRAHTITLSNIGPIEVDKEYQDEIENFQMLIGVSRRQPAKCGVCAYGDKLTISFTTVFQDDRLQSRFFGRLKSDEAAAEMESNGTVMKEADRKHFPTPEYSRDKWKSVIWVFYGALVLIALLLGIINAATYSGLWWSGIAIPGILYAGMTIRYSILRHANLGKSVLLQTLGVQVLMIMTDHVLGYEGWSVNYGVPGAILFADVAIVFLILVNQMNWQSYFMYQLAITVFSFIPLLLWAVGLVTKPLMAAVTAALTVWLLTVTILSGKKRFGNELVRRFHI